MNELTEVIIAQKSLKTKLKLTCQYFKDLVLMSKIREVAIAFGAVNADVKKLQKESQNFGSSMDELNKELKLYRERTGK